MNINDIEKMKYIFSSLFIIENRLKTSCEKIQKDITMKQWLMLAIVSSQEDELNLSEIGKLMGCSRQNVRKLAKPLIEKNYIELVKRENNQLKIILKDQAMKYSEKMNDRHMKTLDLLFGDFSSKDLINFYNCIDKLYQGIDKVEEYGEKLNEKE